MENCPWIFPWLAWFPVLGAFSILFCCLKVQIHMSQLTLLPWSQQKNIADACCGEFIPASTRPQSDNGWFLLTSMNYCCQHLPHPFFCLKDLKGQNKKKTVDKRSFLMLLRRVTETCKHHMVIPHLENQSLPNQRRRASTIITTWYAPALITYDHRF